MLPEVTYLNNGTENWTPEENLVKNLDKQALNTLSHDGHNDCLSEAIV